MPLALIDRIGLALLLEPMTLDDLVMALHGNRKEISTELRHLLASGHLFIPQDRLAELRPLYHLTRRGRAWAEGAITKETTT